MEDFNNLPPIEKQKKIIEVYPFDFNAWMELGRLYEGRQDLESAYKSYGHVLKIRPDIKVARAKLQFLAISLHKSEAELQADIPPELPNRKISRRCPCCGRDVSDPTHVKTSRFHWMFINILKARRARLGHADWKLDDRAFLVIDEATMQEVNMIHVMLKLDGQNGRPRVDTYNQLTAFLGWGPLKALDVIEMVSGILQYEDFFRIINAANPTPEDDIDLTDLIAVIRDRGWDFYNGLSTRTVGDYRNVKGPALFDQFPEYTQPIYVRGNPSEGFSFPTYFCYNTYQANIIKFKSWAEFFKAAHSFGNFGLFMIHMKLLHDKNQMWCDIWWKSHQRLNGIANPISLEESRTRDPPAPSYIEPTWLSVPHVDARNYVPRPDVQIPSTVGQLLQSLTESSTPSVQPTPSSEQIPQTKKFCMFCGTELRPDAKFCNKCGIKC